MDAYRTCAQHLHIFQSGEVVGIFAHAARYLGLLQIFCGDREYVQRQNSRQITRNCSATPSGSSRPQLIYFCFIANYTELRNLFSVLMEICICLYFWMLA